MKFNIVAMCLCLLAALEVAEARQLLGALTDSPTDIKKVLSGHNAHRKDHQVLPLKWSTKLASGAKIWADGCQFEHSTNAERGNAGENLYASYGYPASSLYPASVKSWYDEVAEYNYSDPGSVEFGKYGHFTQMVWKGTKQLGCARAECTTNSPFGTDDTWHLVVCRYSPPGNIMSSSSDEYEYFKKNVLPPK